MDTQATSLEARDSVDNLLADWQRADPTMDTSATGVVVRMGRIRAHIETALAAVYDAHGITAADFAALSILSRSGEVPMSVLADGLYLTAGTVTPRARRLADAGLVRLRQAPGDARVRLVKLTPHGQRVFAEAAPAHLAVQHDALRALSQEQAAQLEDLLALMLGDLENR